MKQVFFLLMLILIFGGAYGQKIIYSEPDKADGRNPEFEIIGKVNGNYLIYKNTRGKKTITGFDNEMKEIFKEEQKQLPNSDRLINTDFFSYNEYAYMIYQYQKKNVVYCMVSKIDATGKQVVKEVELDTTHIGFAADNKIYTVVSSEDKSKLGVFKINSRNKNLYYMTTLLLNDKLEPLKRSHISIPMEERNDYLSDFQLDNDGNLVFCRFMRTGNDNINKASLGIKAMLADTIKWHDLKIDERLLDEIHVKVDNNNNRYLLSSLYYKEKRGSVSGYYFYSYDKQTAGPAMETVASFSDELRKEAKGDAGMKMAFDDYFIKNIITRRDGGFIISAEAYYTTSRFNNWNRWDMLYGSPYRYNSLTNYYYSPYYSRYLWGMAPRSSNQLTRYHADNIMVLSFSPDGKLEWSIVMPKNQYDDTSDDLLSFQIMNTGGSLHFLFNQLEKRLNLLNDYNLSPDGQINRNPTLKNLDKGYEFMPKYGKQVGAKQMIIPCVYRSSYICFAKIDYN
jgi:hypothetical protein